VNHKIVQKVNLTSFFLSRLLFTSWKLAAPSRPKLRLVSTLQKNKKK
jgi:hypothetical protein